VTLTRPPLATLAWTLVAGLAALAGARGTAVATDPASAGPQMVYVRGPADPDCAGELKRARARGDAAKLFLTELQCRVHPRWKCPANCKADELLVTHLVFKVQRDGEPADGQVVRNSESRDFDDMCREAVKSAAPFSTPPPALADGSGAALVKIEFVCDCAQRPRPAR
jgi:hypothetical protein